MSADKKKKPAPKPDPKLKSSQQMGRPADPRLKSVISKKVELVKARAKRPKKGSS